MNKQQYYLPPGVTFHRVYLEGVIAESFISFYPFVYN
jgi:hypothetical protein